MNTTVLCLIKTKEEFGLAVIKKYLIPCLEVQCLNAVMLKVKLIKIFMLFLSCYVKNAVPKYFVFICFL